MNYVYNNDELLLRFSLASDDFLLFNLYPPCQSL